MSETERDSERQAGRARVAVFAELARSKFWETDANLNIVFAEGESFGEETSRDNFALGQNILDVLSDRDASVADVPGNKPPDDRRRIRDAFERCIRDGTAFDLEYRQNSSDGRKLWIRNAGVPVRDESGRIVAVQGSVQDVTEQRNALSGLEDLSKRFEDVLELISDLFFSLDRQWRFTSSNRVHGELIGRSWHEIRGRKIWDAFPQHRDTELEHRLRHAMDASVSEEFEFFSHVFERWLRLSVFPTQEGLAVIGTDMTKERELEREKREFERQRAHTARLATMGEMAATMTHEINQPLSAISMAVENALIEIEGGHPDPDFVLEKLETVMAQVDKQRNIIDHVQAFARLDEHTEETFCSSKPVLDALRIFRHELDFHDIEIDCAILEDAPKLSGHSVRLEQVIVNILSNARDAIADRAEREKGALRRVSIGLSVNDRCVIIEISDSGGGIAPNALMRIFEPFFTTKSAGTGKGTGTGLGMAISQSIVNQMGGTLRAGNVGLGARFTITIPIFEG